MEVIKQTFRVPENRELRIKIPEQVPANELAEVVLFIRKNKQNLKAKIRELKKSKADKIFLEDLHDTLEDFRSVDAEGL